MSTRTFLIVVAAVAVLVFALVSLHRPGGARWMAPSMRIHGSR